MVLLKEGAVIAAGTLNEMFTSLQFRGQLGAHRIGAILEARVASHDPPYGLTQLAFNGHLLFVPLQPVAVGQAVRVHILSNDVSIVTGRTDCPTSVLNILEATIVEIREIVSSLSRRAVGYRSIARGQYYSEIAGHLGVEARAASLRPYQSPGTERGVDGTAGGMICDRSSGYG
ncbi:MAG: hypothetical protein QM706_04475 [Nitrospira sp.]